MKHAQLKELSSRLLGTITDNPASLEHFSTDQSIFRATPDAIVYPQNTADVRKTVQYAAEKTALGRPLPLVPRGLGSDQGGGAVGEGLQVVFPAHMNKLLRLDNGTVTVQPGINFQTLQQTLHTHGRYIAQFPPSLHYATVGGAVAVDGAGEKSVKYGTIRQAVKKLRVVLSDGSLIETSRISGRELNRKKGLTTREGEIYRQFDSLLLDNAALIAQTHKPAFRPAYGYNLDLVRGRNGSFDLSQVFIGSQGTLGFITEITLNTTTYNPRTSLVVGYFSDTDGMAAAVRKLRDLEPSALEMVDRPLLEFYLSHRPSDLAGLVPEQLPAYVLLVEFDNSTQFTQKLRSTRASHIMRRHGASVRLATDPVEQIALWQIRRASVAIWASEGPKAALPCIEDAAVPLDKYGHLIEKTYKLLKKHDLEPALWGHAGLGNLRLQPRLDLTKKKDVEKLFTLTREYGELVLSLGGTVSATQNDSLLRAAHLSTLFDPAYAQLMTATKHIFDPQNLFNPTKKTGATLDYARSHLRTDYAGRHHDFVLYT